MACQRCAGSGALRRESSAGRGGSGGGYQATGTIDRGQRPAHRGLAAALVWNATFPSATTKQLAAWEEEIERCPVGGTGRPLFRPGTRLAHQKQFDRAAINLLHVPILYADDRPLAAAALLAAGRRSSNRGTPSPPRASIASCWPTTPSRVMSPKRTSDCSNLKPCPRRAIKRPGSDRRQMNSAIGRAPSGRIGFGRSEASLTIVCGSMPRLW